MYEITTLKLKKDGKYFESKLCLKLPVAAEYKHRQKYFKWEVAMTHSFLTIIQQGLKLRCFGFQKRISDVLHAVLILIFLADQMSLFKYDFYRWVSHGNFFREKGFRLE
mgnify:CR=1 FL=1